MRSLRRFLLISLLAVLMLSNFVAALHGYQASMAKAEQLLDDKLFDMAGHFLAMPLPDGASPPVDEQLQAFQLIDEQGQLRWRSAQMPVTALQLPDGFSEENVGGYRWRMLQRRGGEPLRTVIVAERLDLRYQLAENVIMESVAPVLLVVPIVGLLLWLIVGRGLSSLTRLANLLRRKRSDDFSPVRVERAPEELQPVLESINQLLRRLDAAFERERRFSADAAHELRTPISAIQIHLHNLRAELSEPSESLDCLSADVARLAHLVEQLLLLHRSNPEHYPRQWETIDLAALAREVSSACFADIDARQQQLSLQGEASIQGDRFALGILVENLLRNANKYSPPGASIDLRIRETDDGASLCVEDSGPGIPEAQLARVRERFYRVGGDRHDSGQSGCGLGLSIVEHIAQLHGAELRLENRAEGGLRVCVQFIEQRGERRGTDVAGSD
ncbi:ATP-binding protein [Spongiibacter tropicus]|uniref:ATP-binding protein n=1 Tax=Spongiibacter tropicus TaxID=454602 RepID=UPI003A99F62C